MRLLSDSDFLQIWEDGFRHHPLDRALSILAAVFPETPYEALADWPLGRRNMALAQLRCNCFGSFIHCRTACRECGEKLEFKMNGAILAGEPGDKSPREPIIVNGRSFRLPTSRDLAYAAAESDSRKALIRLIEKCLLEPAEPRNWSPEELEDIGDGMALADPFAETRISLHCPSCSHEWEEALEIASFFWEEIEARVRRLLLEVHSLTLAYGWSEAEILSLSERRRAAYLSMVQA